MPFSTRSRRRLLAVCTVAGALLVLFAALVPAPVAAADASPPATPDEQARVARDRLTEVRQRAEALLDEPCPSPAAWDGWLERVVGVAAELIGVADIDGALRKRGASPEALQAFDDAKGGEVGQILAATAARRKIEACAAAAAPAPPSTQALVDRVYERADVEKLREETSLGLAALYQPVKRPRVVIE